MYKTFQWLLIIVLKMRGFSVILVLGRCQSHPFLIPPNHHSISATMTFFSYKKWPYFCSSDDIFIYYSPCPGPSSHVSLNEWPVLSPVSGIIFWIHKIRLADSVIDSHSTMHCLRHCSYHTILTFPDFFIFYSTFKLLILEEGLYLVNNAIHFLALDRYHLAHDWCYKYVYWINE